MFDGFPYEIEFDIAAIIIFGVILYYTYTGKKLPTVMNRIYKLLLHVAALSAVLNLCVVIYSRICQQWNPVFKYALFYVFLLAQNMVTPIWFLYVSCVVRKTEKDWKKSLYLLPVLIILCSFFITPMTDFVFYFDEQGMYHNGPGMPLLYAAALACLLLSCYLLIRYKESIKMKERLEIMVFVITTIGGVLAQSFFPGIRLIGFFSSLACLVTYISLQNQEDFIDAATGIFNRTAAITTVSNFIRNKYPFYMVVLAIDRFKDINEKYGFETGDALLRAVSDFLMGILPNCAYRLDGDNLALIFGKNCNSLENVVEIVKKRFRRHFKIGNESVKLSTCICCISYPEDAKGVAEIIDISNQAIQEAKEIGCGALVYAREYVENREKKISELEAQKRLLEKMTREAEAARQEAEEADRTKSIFLANMSHEIRTPMNTILGMTELILRENIAEPVRENVQNIKRAGDSLICIINDILDISKIESGKLEIVNERYYLAPMLCDIIQMISSRMRGKNVEFIPVIDYRLPEELYGDELRLRQILLNLLTNAVKFTSEGQITFSLTGERKGDFVSLHFIVKDTGFGIKQEDMGRLFESFQRFDSVKTRKIEGTGLGLAICRQLLTLMGGEIGVESKYGEGSSFYVDLEQKISKGRPMMEMSGKNDRNVLVIKEETDMQMMNALEELQVPAMYENESSAMLLLFREEINFTHIFVPYSCYETRKEQLSAYAKKIKIVVITEFGQFPAIGEDIAVIQKPLYCLNVGKALDGKLQTQVKETHYDTFIAPDAKILIVDDNEVNLKVVEGLLKPYRMRITKAQSGRECLELLKSRRFDLVFLDHMMPEMDGVETLLLIRKQEACKNLRVVALTANAIRGVRDTFLEYGFDDYISKPIDTNRLDEVLRQNLRSDLILPKEKETKEEEKNFFYDIKGIDLQKGLNHCLGSVDFYCEVLEKVVLEGRGKVKRMEEYLAAGQIKKYMIEAHALKSVAASIGASELSELALVHEQEAKAENLGFIRKNGRELPDQYGELLDAIERVLRLHREESRKEENEAFLSRTAFKRRLADIWKNILDYEDEEALIGIETLVKHSVSEKEEEILREAKDALRLLDYKKAAGIIEALLSKQE